MRMDKNARLSFPPRVYSTENIYLCHALSISHDDAMTYLEKEMQDNDINDKKCERVTI